MIILIRQNEFKIALDNKKRLEKHLRSLVRSDMPTGYKDYVLNYCEKMHVSLPACISHEKIM